MVNKGRKKQAEFTQNEIRKDAAITTQKMAELASKHLKINFRQTAGE